MCVLWEGWGDNVYNVETIKVLFHLRFNSLVFDIFFGLNFAFS